MVWNPSKIHLPPAKWGLLLAQNGYRNRENEIVTCANAHRNRDNEIVTCANPHRNRDSEIVTLTMRLRLSRWDFVHHEEPFISLAMDALQAKQRLGSMCEGTLCTLYMTIFHARYTHKQACKDNCECDNIQIMNQQTLSHGSDRTPLLPKNGKADDKKKVCWRINV